MCASNRTDSKKAARQITGVGPKYSLAVKYPKSTEVLLLLAVGAGVTTSRAASRYSQKATRLLVRHRSTAELTTGFDF